MFITCANELHHFDATAFALPVKKKQNLKIYLKMFIAII